MTEPRPAVTVRVNDTDRPYPDGATVLDVVADATGRDLGPDGRPLTGGGLAVAIAVDGAVVPRSRWATTPLHPGARIELVDAVQGG